MWYERKRELKNGDYGEVMSSLGKVDSGLLMSYGGRLLDDLNGNDAIRNVFDISLLAKFEMEATTALSGPMTNEINALSCLI